MAGRVPADTLADAEKRFTTSLRTARVAGDNALGANALSFWTVSAYNTGRLHDAEDMANTALASVRGKATPRVEALLLTRRGRARAHLGDARCWEDFDRAETLLAQAGGHADPDWSYWFDRAEILGARASSHRDMNQPGPAEAAFAQAHALFDPTSERTHALYLTRQAEAHLALGDIDAAAAVSEQAIDQLGGTNSARGTTTRTNLRAQLTAHRQARPVADFLDLTA